MGQIEAKTEILRSSFDCDGAKVELLFDEEKARFTIASRWANLAHIGIPVLTRRSKDLALARASAVFESVCFEGATREAARAAKRAAMSLFPSHCVNDAGFEREVARRAALSAATGAQQ